MSKCLFCHTIKPGTPENQNTEHRRNSRTPRNSGGTTEHYPEHQQNTPDYQRNTNITPLEHSGITNHIIQRTVEVFLRGNLNLKIETFNSELKHSLLLI